MRFGVTIARPGETEAGTAGKQPCRGISWWAHRDDDQERGTPYSAPVPKPYRIERPHALKNPRPTGGILTYGERRLSSIHQD